MGGANAREITDHRNQSKIALLLKVGLYRRHATPSGLADSLHEQTFTDAQFNANIVSTQLTQYKHEVHRRS